MSKGSTDNLKASHKRHNVPDDMENIVEQVFTLKQHFRHNANAEMDKIVDMLYSDSENDLNGLSQDISKTETPALSNKKKSLGSHTNMVLSQGGEEKQR